MAAGSALVAALVAVVVAVLFFANSDTDDLAEAISSDGDVPLDGPPGRPLGGFGPGGPGAAAPIGGPGPPPLAPPPRSEDPPDVRPGCYTLPLPTAATVVDTST
nr:hypothetical protein [Micromonospora sp. DSM 115978]